jgi:hypothetical protein
LDPQFTGAVNHDYSISDESPCINAGDPDPAYNDVDGSRNDVGAIPFLAPSFLCGDPNGDVQSNVGDAVFLINYIFNGGAAPDPVESGDANCDGQGNVGDAVYLINYVFNGGAPPCCL